MGSQLDVLLGASSFTEFSDRLEFMGAIARSDTDLATAAHVAGQEASWAADRFTKAETERQTELDTISSRRDDVVSLLSQQESAYKQTQHDFGVYQDWLDAQRSAFAGPQGGTGGGTGYVPSTYVPPANASGAQIAVGAAESVLGAPYVFGSGDPNVGFDCSGLTSWAWAQAGVSIPHSSAEQFILLPHFTDPSLLQPGDLVFYYSPISHVALYIGNGVIIHARHPGPSGEVQRSSMNGYGNPVAFARPG